MLAGGRALKSRRFFPFFIWLIVLSLLTIALIYLIFFQFAFKRAGPLAEDKALIIEPASSINAISRQLKKQSMISSPHLFILNVKLRGKAGALRAGEYMIPAHASMAKIMDILLYGKAIEHNFTIPEGVTVAQIFKKIAQNPLLKGDLPKDLPKEGSLIADTISFYRGTERRKLLALLQEKQAALIAKIWQGRDRSLPLKTMDEMVILASIVEKETGVPNERALIAGVFYNRLKKNMRLQSDPTVVYGIFGGEGKPSGRPIYRSDLAKETPYNTYKIKGLPPTPIAIPGKDALCAVAHPAPTKALYFVANGQGGHAFAESLSQHIINVKKWRRLEGKNNG